MYPSKKMIILRIVSGRTQKEVSKILCMTASAYGKLERDITYLTVPRAKQVAGIYNSDIRWLLKEDPFAVIIRCDKNGKLTMEIMADEAPGAAAQAAGIISLKKIIERNETATAKLEQTIEQLCRLLNRGKKQKRRTVRKTNQSRSRNLYSRHGR